MSDPTSDLTFRPESVRRFRRDDEAWEAVVREELAKLRRRSPGGPRVVPAARPPGPAPPDPTPPPAARAPPARPPGPRPAAGRGAGGGPAACPPARVTDCRTPWPGPPRLSAA